MVRALRVFSGGRSVVRALTIIFLANVRVEAEARFGADSLQRLVGIYFHGCSCSGPGRNRDRVVVAVRLADIEGPLSVQ